MSLSLPLHELIEGNLVALLRNMLVSTVLSHVELPMVEELVEHVWVGFCGNDTSHLSF